MKKIVAIGGGKIDKLKTLAIDREIVRLTNKKNPKALFIPTASGDEEGYWKTFQEIYGKKLGCKTEVLYLFKKRPSKKVINEKILSSDLIYVGGGNTMRMLKLWRRLGIDKMLKKAYDKGIVLSGLSAGAICWFKSGSCDSLKFGPLKNAKFIKLKGLDLIDLIVCPHYDSKKSRRSSFKKMIKTQRETGIALESCSALEIIGDKYRIIKSSKRAKTYLLYKKNGKVEEKVLPVTRILQPLKDLQRVLR